ncbi:hypothetical protein FR943_18690 [Mycobacterium sp. TNTM28]|uniref:Transmembrane protein n=1 Tax=[Mycobacterium] fortunisiensis TaxID=2600579 RepID=A0ABS6KQN8_9MYCO|nr:hypothetical protein [[Mycobacterium] fortunisiensis]MBU9765860.1 hypothetical protein [[Mycobacterium] fortunisiensis]
MTSGEITTEIETELRAIEQRVFEDVWIGTWRARALAGLAAVLAATAVAAVAVAAGAAPATGGHRVSVVAVALFGLSAGASTFALLRRRFRWCCLATCLSALATVSGAGTFWWHHTAHTSFWLPAAGGLTAAALTAGWLGVCLAPVASSQPDMRAGLS